MGPGTRINKPDPGGPNRPITRRCSARCYSLYYARVPCNLQRPPTPSQRALAAAERHLAAARPLLTIFRDGPAVRQAAWVRPLAGAAKTPASAPIESPPAGLGTPAADLRGPGGDRVFKFSFL